MTTIQDTPARALTRLRPFPLGFVAWTLFTVACSGFEFGVMVAVTAFWRDPYAPYIPWQMWALLVLASVSVLVCVWRLRAAWRAER